MAKRPIPVTYDWLEVEVTDPASGEVRRCKAMVPKSRFDNICGRQFDLGEDYTLVPHEDRSMASHRQYFAAIKDGFNNLPERLHARWPTAEHLRKWCLVECNLFDEKEFDCPDETFAKRLGYFIRTEDEYAVISIHKTEGTKRVKVIVRRAKSQSMQSMGKAEFQASKQAVLDLIESFIGLERGQLKKHAGKNA